jgi:hypothetical protein
VVRELLLAGLVPRPTLTESGFRCAALWSELRNQVADHRFQGASQPCRPLGLTQARRATPSRVA